jgi:transcriptional regulator with XRE-family HTH domain
MGRNEDNGGRGRAAAYVRDLLRDKGIGVVELATMAHLNKNTVSAFLSGTRWPNTATLDQIEDALKLGRGTLEAIAGGEVVGTVQNEGSQPSAASSTLALNTLKVRTAALGVEFEVAFTDAADRERALMDVSKALAAIVRETATGGDSAPVSLLGDGGD